jgi:hypothetical protein
MGESFRVILATNGFDFSGDFGVFCTMRDQRVAKLHQCGKLLFIKLLAALAGWRCADSPELRHCSALS